MKTLLLSGIVIGMLSVNAFGTPQDDYEEDDPTPPPVTATPDPARASYVATVQDITAVVWGRTLPLGTIFPNIMGRPVSDLATFWRNASMTGPDAKPGR